MPDTNQEEFGHMQTLSREMRQAGDDPAHSSGYDYQAETRSEPAPWAAVGDTRNEHVFFDAGDDAAGDRNADGDAENDLFMLLRGQDSGPVSGGDDKSWIDTIDLLDGIGAPGENGIDWTISIDGDGHGNGSDGSWLELADGKVETTVLPDGGDIGLQESDNFSW